MKPVPGKKTTAIMFIDIFLMVISMLQVKINNCRTPTPRSRLLLRPDQSQAYINVHP